LHCAVYLIITNISENMLPPPSSQTKCRWISTRLQSISPSQQIFSH